MEEMISKDAVMTILHHNWGKPKGYTQSMEEISELPSVQPKHDYQKAFSVACELLIGANLFGTTEETMFREIMDKDGIVSSLGYEKYILDNLARLTGEDDGTD